MDVAGLTSLLAEGFVVYDGSLRVASHVLVLRCSKCEYPCRDLTAHRAVIAPCKQYFPSPHVAAPQVRINTIPLITLFVKLGHFPQVMHIPGAPRLVRRTDEQLRSRKLFAANPHVWPSSWAIVADELDRALTLTWEDLILQLPQIIVATHPLSTLLEERVLPRIRKISVQSNPRHVVVQPFPTEQVRVPIRRRNVGDVAPSRSIVREEGKLADPFTLDVSIMLYRCLRKPNAIPFLWFRAMNLNGIEEQPPFAAISTGYGQNAAEGPIYEALVLPLRCMFVAKSLLFVTEWNKFGDFRFGREVLRFGWVLRVGNEGNGVVCDAFEVAAIIEAEGVPEHVVCLVSELTGAAEVAREVTVGDVLYFAEYACVDELGRP